MKKIFIFSLITLGVTSIIAQLVVIRELMISFYGNEFFIGWVVFSWLLWTGIGSLFLGKLFKKENLLKTFATTYILVALFLPLEIYLIRFGKNIIGGTPGEIPNLVPTLLYAFLIIAPLCLILGFQFVVANKFWVLSLSGLRGRNGHGSSERSERESKAESLSPPRWGGRGKRKDNTRNLLRNTTWVLGKSHFYETLGFIVGGLIFSYLLIFINEVRTSSILALLNLITAGLVLFLIKNKLNILKIIAIILAIIFVGMFVCAKGINIETTKLRFPNQELIESQNSIYGNVAVTKTGKQYNFYESGLLLGSNKEEIFNEHLIHFPLLYQPTPRNILLIGMGVNGAINEILKHYPNKVYYLELDPQIIKTAKKYISPEFQQQLNDERVTIINLDARYFLKNTKEKFDVIIVNLPDPSTALINRFYTQEFFKEVNSHLNPFGIFAIHLSSSPNYLSPELENLQASVYKTIKQVFIDVIILPEDTNFFIASPNHILDYNPRPLIVRFNTRGINNNFVIENYIKERLANDRNKTVLNTLETNKQAKINQDQHPISYYYNFAYWISYFHSGLAKSFGGLSTIKFKWIAAFLFLLITLRAVFRKKTSLKIILPLTMAVAGFSLMASEIIIIFAFQVFYGYLYYKIGLIITALMVGMAIGAWLGTKKIPRAKIKSLIEVHGLIILFCSIFLFGSWYLFKVQPTPSLIIEIIFLLLAALIGAIVGFEFPIVNKLYLSQIKNAPQKVGIIYGVDLIGSCLGASLISIFAIPIFGIYQTLLFLVILNILIIILFLK